VLQYSGATVAKPAQQHVPELFIASADFNARMTQGAPEKAAVIVRNTGASSYSSYSVSAGFIDQAGTKTILGTAPVYSHARDSDQKVEIQFTPPRAGTYTLFFAADSAGEVPEESESNNEMLAGGVEVSGSAGRLQFTRVLQPGWNLVPFSPDAGYTHSCLLSDAYAYAPQAASYLQLNTSSLSFSSESDAAAFISAHGTAARPKSAAAIGGAWLLTPTQCQLGYDAPLSGTGWRTLSPGFNLVTMLPADSGSTISNLASGCVLIGASRWDAGSQSWLELSSSTAIGAGDAGDLLLLRVQSACSLK
jgi:hypothetical protein